MLSRITSRAGRVPRDAALPPIRRADFLTYPDHAALRDWHDRVTAIERRGIEDLFQFQNTLRVEEPVALAHADGDWDEPVMISPQRIEPHLVEGGVLVIDDDDDWSGCRKAVDACFAYKREQYDFVRQARLHIVRKPAR